MSAAPHLPDWLDRDRYPFDPETFDAPPGRLSYVDEGEGLPVLALHGNPTWSFLYRRLIRTLSGDGAYRAIAPDLLGFGLSAKPPGFSYLPAAHATVLARLVETLDLREFALVVHDWGGPIGLDYATRHPDRLRALVVTNTWLWSLRDSPRARQFSRVVGSRAGRALVRRGNLFARVFLPMAFHEPRRLSPAVHRQYTRPLATPDDRTASWVFPRELLGSERWLDALWDRRGTLVEADVPVLLAWGTRDPILRPRELRRWRRLFPDARVARYDDAGHYVPEEKSGAFARAVRSFLDTV